MNEIKPSDQNALSRQEGGEHYKLPIQPVQYIHANGIGYFEGNVIKYVTRWRSKGGIEDLKKARHYIDLLIDLEQANGKQSNSRSPRFNELLKENINE